MCPILSERVLGETFQVGTNNQDGSIVPLDTTRGQVEQSETEFQPIRDETFGLNPIAHSSPTSDLNRPRSKTGSIAGREPMNILGACAPYLECPPPVDMTRKANPTRQKDKTPENVQESVRSKRGADLRYSSDPGPSQAQPHESERDVSAPVFLGTLNEQNGHRTRNQVEARNSNRSPNAERRIQYDEQGWPIIDWPSFMAIPALPSLNNTLDMTLARDFPENLVEVGPTRADLNNLGTTLRGTFKHTQQEVDRRVNEIGLKAETKCHQFSMEMRELCDRKLRETRDMLLRHEERALIRERDPRGTGPTFTCIGPAKL